MCYSLCGKDKFGTFFHKVMEVNHGSFRTEETGK